jgi:hypothetical protein
VNDKGQVDPSQRDKATLPVTRGRHRRRLRLRFDGDSCALDRSGAVSCWGGSSWSHSINPPAKPTAPVGLERDVLEIASGPSAYERTSLCGVLRTGSVRCVGSIGEQAFVQRARSGEAEVPWPKLSDLAVGADYACGLQDDDRVACWGSQSDDKPVLGLLARSSYLAPMPLFDVPPAQSVHAGVAHTCIVTRGGARSASRNNRRARHGTRSRQSYLSGSVLSSPYWRAAACRARSR